MHVSYSASGGAGAAAGRLVEALNFEGINAEFIAASQTSISSRPLRHPIVAAAAAIDNFVIANSDSALFSLARERVQTLDLLRVASNYDVVNLHWIPGALTISTVSRILSVGVPVVWTLHDMLPFTGGCHYSLGCKRFVADCSECPQVRNLFQNSVSKNLLAKRHAYGGSIHFIAPSKGMFNLAISGGVASSGSVSYIPNPLNSISFVGNESFQREPVFGFVAADVDDPRKGLQSVLEWWRHSGPRNFTLEIIGRGSLRHASERDRVFALGEVSQEEVTRRLRTYCGLIVASTEDNAPNVVTEAHSQGLPVTTLDQVKLRDWLEQDGALVLTPEQVEQAFERGLSERDAQKMNDFVAKRSYRAAALSYIDVYKSLLVRRA